MNTDLKTTIELFDRPDVKLIGFQAMAIGQVFRACYTSALPADRINEIVIAIHGSWACGEVNLRPTLTKLVKLGVLRSRRQGTVTLYEVNY